MKLLLKILVFILIFVLFAYAILMAVIWWKERVARVEYPPLGDFVIVEERKIHVQTMGDPTNPHVVLIHGANGTTRDGGFKLAPRLAEEFYVFLVDRPGQGYSERAIGYGGALSTKGESPQLQARLLRDAVAALGAKDPIIVGHSFGGAVAMAWAAAYHAEIAGVVPVAGVSNTWDTPLDPFYATTSTLWGAHIVLPLIAGLAPQSRVDDTLISIFAPQKAPDGYVDNVGIGISTLLTNLRANAQQIRVLKGHVAEMIPFYGEISVPVEIIHGTADTIVPHEIHAATLINRVQHGNLTTLAGIGHMPHHTNQDAVIDAIKRIRDR